MGRAKKQRRDLREASTDDPPTPTASPSGGQWAVALATLAGVGALLAMTVSSSREIGRINNSLDDRLQKIESRIAQLDDKIDKMPAKTPPRRGPDPNKIYQIETAGSPAKGPADAPVVIAEFSDFQ
jgi:protein-disulfide isomerase